jgi:hypothetical protein
LATVSPALDFNPDVGPMVANVGPKNHTDVESKSSAFRPSAYNNDKVKYYYDQNQTGGGNQ